MFSAQLIHDPESAVATNLEQSILKLNALMKAGNNDTRWEYNISNAAKDLEEQYHADFIRYLANPAGYKTENTGNINQEIEQHILKSMPEEGKATIPADLEQRYTCVKSGNDFNILVENISLNEEEHDEKHPHPN